MSAEAKNLEAIYNAIEQHDRNCPFPAAEIRMAPFEADRLGWEEVRGIPVVPDPQIGTGRFKVVCANADHGQEPIREDAATPQRVPTAPQGSPSRRVYASSPATTGVGGG